MLMGYCGMDKIINRNKNISNGTRKSIIFILLIAFLVFISAKIVFAYSFFGGVFGGRITNMPALEIASLEGSGYVCSMSGTSISIIPIGSPPGTPTSYFIPSYITPRTRTTPAIGQLILGRYSGKTVITCTLTLFLGSHRRSTTITTVSLDTINLFGTSRGGFGSRGGGGGGAASAVPSGPASQ